MWLSPKVLFAPLPFVLTALMRSARCIPECLDQNGMDRGYPLPEGAPLAPASFAVGLTLYIPALDGGWRGGGAEGL